jgi:hypothetical protein
MNLELNDYKIVLEAELKTNFATYTREIYFHTDYKTAVLYSLRTLTRAIGMKIREFTGNTWVSIQNGDDIVFILLNGKILYHEIKTCKSCKHFSPSGLLQPGYCMNSENYKTSVNSYDEACSRYEQRETESVSLSERTIKREHVILNY